MSTRHEDFLGMLQLRDDGARTAEDIFVGRSEVTPHGRVYGGQVLAQCLVAAQRTVDPARAVHSMHGYFLRPGHATQPITFAVDRVHDGGSFSRRRTQAFQNGNAIFSAILSFQVPRPGLEHALRLDLPIPDPESIADPTAVSVPSEDSPLARFWAGEKAFELRRVPDRFESVIDGSVVEHEALWMRTRVALADDPLVHRAALAYASDYGLLNPILTRHGRGFMDEGLRVASLDHAIWWHEDGRADEWMLYLQGSPSARGGRGLAFGRIYDRAGRLLANVAQEGLVSGA